MNEPIELDEFTATLQRELAHASEQRARGLHVQVTVPADSAYQWFDGDGEAHAVHLPTRIKAAPMRYRGEPVEDGGPAAVFRIDSGGAVPPSGLLGQMAAELYRECVRWGRVHHAGWEAAPGEDHALLPGRFEDIVRTAMYMDVS